MSEKENNIREKIMAHIKKGPVQMRPRWHFVLFSSFALTGIAILLLSMLYVVSLIIFFLRKSGVWYTPGFGARGWFSFLHAAPGMLLILLFVFAVLLELLVRKYSFVYRKSLFVTLAGIVGLVAVGGIGLASTSLHNHLESEAHHGRLPPPFGMWYDKSARPPHPDDVHRGVVIMRIPRDATIPATSLIIFSDEEGTSTIMLTSQTRFPYGEDFADGDILVVIGDKIGTGTLRAYGVREIGND